MSKPSPELEMDLDELKVLLEKCQPGLRQLFVKALNIYADPMNHAESPTEKRDHLKQAIETTSGGRL